MNQEKLQKLEAKMKALMAGIDKLALASGQDCGAALAAQIVRDAAEYRAERFRPEYDSRAERVFKPSHEEKVAWAAQGWPWQVLASGAAVAIEKIAKNRE